MNEMVEFEGRSVCPNSRRSRASQISAQKRAYERDNNVTLTKVSVRYSETYGFAHSSIIRYSVSNLKEWALDDCRYWATNVKGNCGGRVEMVDGLITCENCRNGEKK